MISAIISLYGWRYPAMLVYMLQSCEYRAEPYLAWFWRTQDFSRIQPKTFKKTNTARLFLVTLRAGMLAQIIAGLILIYAWRFDGFVGGWQFGLALILSYPVVWAHLAVVMIWLGWLTRPKKLGRAIVCRLLERQVKKLRKRHTFKVVAVAGSIGKTSTKAAIAGTLAASKRVRWQSGNYNDRVTVPLIFFDQSEPNLLNVFAWLKVLLQNAKQIRGDYPYDLVVVEFGPDGPGQMRYFAYTHPDVLVLTAIAPEHMEFFGTLDSVAREELVSLEFSQQVLVNADDTPAKYLKGKDVMTYGLVSTAMYYAAQRKARGLDGQDMTLHLGQDHELTLGVPMLGEQGAKVVVAAAAAASLLGCTPKQIEKGLRNITHFPGRMQILRGIDGSTLIDDTYNSSPVAAKAALDVLYSAKTKQRVAIMGDMNELGAYSKQAHQEVGKYCEPKKLDMVITIGEDAAKYLAPAAKAHGCKVEICDSPIEAGEFVKRNLKPGAVVLAKGSQNRVFAEEALKPLLANPDDATKLVRQSAYWLSVKHAQFR